MDLSNNILWATVDDVMITVEPFTGAFKLSSKVNASNNFILSFSY